jgi:hypothetical protein
MASKATTPEEYLAELPVERQEPMERLHATIVKHLPKGFKQGMGYGMVCYSVPHTLYPAGYHCDPKQPLPFISLGSTKGHISLHHMGLYADAKLLEWFTAEYPKHSTAKLDMGKGCVRFKKPEHIPYELIGELVEKMTPQDWIGAYEAAFRQGKEAKAK